MTRTPIWSVISVQRVGVGRHAVDRAGGLGGERRDALGAATDGQVVDPGLVEDRGDEGDVLLAGLDQRRLTGGVLLHRGAHRVRGGPALTRGRRVVGREGRRDDVAVLEVAVRRHVVRLAGGEEGDVGTDDRVDLVLDDAQLALAGRGLDVGDERPPGRVVEQHRGRSGGEPFDQAHQDEQLATEPFEGAARLVLVLEGPTEAEQRDRRGVRIDLDRAAPAARARVHVQAEPSGEPRPARTDQLGLAGVGRMGAGVEAGEVLVERGFGRPVAGGVADHQRGVDRDQALALDVRAEGRGDLVVRAHRRDVDQVSAVVEHGEAGGLTGAPGQVDAHEVHGPTLPYRRTSATPSTASGVSHPP